MAVIGLLVQHLHNSIVVNNTESASQEKDMHLGRVIIKQMTVQTDTLIL